MNNFNKFVLILLLLLTSLIYINASENDKEIKKATNISFKRIHDLEHSVTMSNLIAKHTPNELKELFAASTSRSGHFKLGLNLLIFGLASGVLGGTLIGVGFILVWALAVALDTTFQTALALIIIQYALVEESYYASLAIACWVIGGILAVLFLLIIPGIILMAVGSSRAVKRMRPLDNAIGVAVRL